MSKDCVLQSASFSLESRLLQLPISPGAEKLYFPSKPSVQFIHQILTAEHQVACLLLQSQISQLISVGRVGDAVSSLEDKTTTNALSISVRMVRI